MFFLSYSGGRNGEIINHDVRIAEHVVSTLHEHTQDVCGLAWSPDGRMLASGGNDNLLNIWSPLVAGQVSLHSFIHHQAAVKVSMIRNKLDKYYLIRIHKFKLEKHPYPKFTVLLQNQIIGLVHFSVYYCLLYNTLLNYRDLIGYLRSRDIQWKFPFS